MSAALSPLLLAGLLAAADTGGSVTLLVGSRTAPEAALEIGEDEFGEVEPAAMGVLLVDGSASFESGLWMAGAAELWTYVPEAEATVFRLSPGVGWGSGVGSKGYFDVAGRYDLVIVPGISEASSGRGELLVGGSRQLGVSHTLLLSVQGIDRRYPNAVELGFTSGEFKLGISGQTELGRLRYGVSGGAQSNLGYVMEDTELEGVFGWQVRARFEAGVSAGAWDLDLGYALYLATAGDDDDIARAQFTLIGAYADDADAVSSGGFSQHRTNVSVAWTSDPWVLTATALGRVRVNSSEAVGDGVSQTIHAQVGARRPVRGMEGQIATGVSAVSFTSGLGYTDVYGWVGLKRPF